MKARSLGICFTLVLVATGEGRAQRPSSSFASVPVKGELSTYFWDAAWLPGEEVLLISDGRKRQLVALRPDGSLQALWAAFPSEGGDDAYPTALVREADATCALYAFAWQPKPGKVCFGPDGRLLRQESLDA